MTLVLYIFAGAFRLALCYLVLRDKSVQETAMAWILLMFFLPLAGLFLYLIFGKDYRTEKVRQYVHAQANQRFVRRFRRSLESSFSPPATKTKWTVTMSRLQGSLRPAGKGTRSMPITPLKSSLPVPEKGNSCWKTSGSKVHPSGVFPLRKRRFRSGSAGCPAEKSFRRGGGALYQQQYVCVAHSHVLF